MYENYAAKVVLRKAMEREREERQKLPRIKYGNHKSCKVAFLAFSRIKKFEKCFGAKVMLSMKTMITRAKKKQKRLGVVEEASEKLRFE